MSFTFRAKIEIQEKILSKKDRGTLDSSALVEILPEQAPRAASYKDLSAAPRRGEGLTAPSGNVAAA